MASRRPSPTPLAGQTWRHVSTPNPIDTVPPSSKGFSPLPCSPGSLIPAGDCSWSGDWKQLFANTNSSDWPTQSAASSASWSDELENESTKRLSEQYELLEAALYSDSSNDILSNPNLALECKQWKERFPHLRTVGVGIQLVSEGNELNEFENLNEEEVIASHGTCENVPEGDTVPDSELQICPVSDQGEITEEDIERYRDRVKKEVLAQLFSRVWPNIIKKIDPVFKKILERSKLPVQVPTKIIVEDSDCSMVQANLDVGFPSQDSFLRISPIPTKESSPKKSIMCAASPVPQVRKPQICDYVPSPITLINGRNLSTIFKHPPSITLMPPAVVFPTSEKLLSPIPAESRSALQSARNSKKLSPKSTSPSGKIRLQPQGQTQGEGRFCTKDKPRASAQAGTRKMSRGYWNRHGMLPPISLKENIKSTSSATQRSTSALTKFGKQDLDTRPNTSLPTKSNITLLPLNEGNKKKNQMELAQEWLEKQLMTSHHSKHHLSTYVDTSSRWRSHSFGYKK